MENQKPDHIGNIIVFILLGLLLYAGYLSYKSIDWTVLKRLESQPLTLPNQIPATPSAQIIPTNTATNSSSIPATSSPAIKK